MTARVLLIHISGSRTTGVSVKKKNAVKQQLNHTVDLGHSFSEGFVLLIPLENIFFEPGLFARGLTFLVGQLYVMFFQYCKIIILTLWFSVFVPSIFSRLASVAASLCVVPHFWWFYLFYGAKVLPRGGGIVVVYHPCDCESRSDLCFYSQCAIF